MMTAAEQKIFFGIGPFARMRYVYLRDHRQRTFDEMKREGSLTQHLEEVQRKADEFMELEVGRYLDKHPAPDKNSDPLGWVRHMNTATNIVEEFARRFVVYPEEDRT